MDHREPTAATGTMLMVISSNDVSPAAFVNDEFDRIWKEPVAGSCVKSNERRLLSSGM
jgi:hypothetical protein